MLNDLLHPVSLEDIALLQRFLPRCGTGDGNLSVANLITRGIAAGTRVGLFHNHLLVERTPFGCSEPVLHFPAGCCLSLDFVEELEALALEAGRPLTLYGVIPDMLQWIARSFPKRSFTLSSASGGWDYLYRRDAVASLEGRKLAGKRNFARRYHAAHPKAEFVPLTPETIPMARAFLSSWYAGTAMTESLQKEADAIDLAFHHWEALGLTGGVLLSDGVVHGFTYGSQVSPHTWAVHIEKADRNVTGAYPVLFAWFAAALPDTCAFLNREEDIDLPGLRKAKLDWNPCGMLQKGTLTLVPEKTH